MNQATLSDLQTRWTALWSRLAVPPDQSPPLDPLLIAYQSPIRAYHNLQHIEQCLVELDGLRHQCENADLVEIAIWFHDVVYDAQRGDNEERSAEVAAEALKSAGASSADVQKVVSLILATKHTAVPVDNDECVLVDIDLSILGQSPLVFDTYEKAIRLEYAHVSIDAFRAGRAAILRRFLDRPAIYLTKVLRDQLEDQSRENLRRSISNLTQPA